VAQPPPRPSGRRPLLTTTLTAALVVAVDQVTKSLALSIHRPVHVLGPFGLGLTFNSGAAFSLFTGAAPVIAPLATVVVAALVVAAWRSRSVPLSVGLGLILGGALGNLADRAFRGHGGAVVDFVTLTHWPTFNVADACITVGAVLVVVTTLLRSRTHERH
jgi:signal peptidase II